jgi:hypothetical protein
MGIAAEFGLDLFLRTSGRYNIVEVFDPLDDDVRFHGLDRMR